MDLNSDQNNDLNEQTLDSNHLNDNNQNEGNSLENHNQLNDNKDLNQCSTDVKTTVVTDSDPSVDTTSGAVCDQNIDTNCDNSEDNEPNGQNVANDDNQMNVENNESNLTSNDSSDSSDKFMATDDDDEEDNLYGYDPTPSTAYPSIKWHSVQQLQQREYGKLIKPGAKRPTNLYESQSFRRYAYNSLYFFQRLELMAKYEEHSGLIGCVNCLNFNSSGDRLISGSDDLRICIWDWNNSICTQKYHSGHTSNVFQCRWCADEQHIVSCARDGQVRICNVNHGGSTVVSNKLAQHKGAAHKLTLTAPQVILSCGEDAVVFEIDLRVDKPNKLLTTKNSSDQRVPLYSIHSNMVFNPLHFVVSGRDPFVRIYDRRYISNEGSVAPVLSFCPEKLKQSKHSVTCAQYNSTADKVLSTYNDEDIYTFDAKNGSSEYCYKGHRNSATVKGCSWFGDDFIVSGSDDGYVYGWDYQTQHIVMSLYADENGVVNCIEPHPTAPIMATSGLEDDVKVWVPSANEWPQTLKGIKQRICTNVRDRQRSQLRFERLNAEGFDGEDGAIDASMIYMILRHMRRHSRRRRNDNDTNVVEDSEDTDTEDSDADNGGTHECIQS